MTQPASWDLRRSVAPLGLFYACLYASVGITMPFLPQHMKALGLSGTDLGLLMAAYPLMQVLVPPAAGFVADRTRRGALLLSLLTFGHALAFVPLLFATTRAAIAPWLTVAAVCIAPLSMLADSLTLERLGPDSAQYPRVRLWGSLGFVATTLAFGAFWTGERPATASAPPVVLAAIAAATVAFGASLLVRGRGGAGNVHLSEAPAILRDPRMRRLVAATSLHWLAFAPHNLMFAVYLESLGHSPWITSLGLALGVLAEVSVMALFPRFGRRFAPRHILAVAFAAAAVRWLLVALSRGAVVLVLLNLLHGLAFGAFMVSSVTYVNDLAPTRLRATAQALFVSLTYGVGGFLGYVLVGRLFDLFEPRQVFMAAAVLEVVPFLLSLRLPDPRKAVERVLGFPEVTP
ncbi:MAG: MFS transporter [Myxococcales bacterium]